MYNAAGNHGMLAGNVSLTNIRVRVKNSKMYKKMRCLQFDQCINQNKGENQHYRVEMNVSKVFPMK